MWLQMMWLMTAPSKIDATDEIKRCAGPGCDKIIYFDSSDLPDDPKFKGARRARNLQQQGLLLHQLPCQALAAGPIE